MKYCNKRINNKNFFSIGIDEDTGSFCIEIVYTGVAWFSRFYRLSKSEYQKGLNDILSLNELAEQIYNNKTNNKIRFLYSEIAYENKINEPERSVICKAIYNRHLNIEDRIFINKNINKLILIDLLKEIINEFEIFPINLIPNDDYDGVIITKGKEKYLVVEKREVGLMKYDITKKIETNSLAKAIQYFIVNDLKSEIDGIKIK